MFLRKLLSSALAFTLIGSSTRAFAADDVAARDAELMVALRIIAEHEINWTAEEWQEFGWRVGKYALIAAGVVAVGAGLYYVQDPFGWGKKTKSLPQQIESAIERTGQFLSNHGGVAALGVAGPIIATSVANRLVAINSVSEVERLRNASTPDARVYRSHLRRFFKLSLSEQFLIARQDDKMIEDLVRLARWIEAGHSYHPGQPLPDGGTWPSAN